MLGPVSFRSIFFNKCRRVSLKILQKAPRKGLPEALCIATYREPGSSAKSQRHKEVCNGQSGNVRSGTCEEQRGWESPVTTCSAGIKLASQRRRYTLLPPQVYTVNQLADNLLSRRHRHTIQEVPNRKHTKAERMQQELAAGATEQSR